MPQVAPPSAAVVQPGDVLEGRYRLQRVIAAGGMGTVFLAEHVLIQRRVAIKVLHSDLARDVDVVERFMNEARAAGTLGHPNIVESTDMGFARGDVPYIVFEYLEGTLLSDEVYRTGGLPPRRALKIAHQIASALQAAHRAGIVHRDLKTDNIFLTDKDDALDHVKVLDFGISRFLEAGDRTGRGGRRTTLMGTPEFMAPEQILTPDQVDARADIYALGIVLYEMLASRLPFPNENPKDPHDLMHRIIRDEPPPISRDDLPVGLAEAISEKLLAKDRETRYQSMGDVIGALEAFLSVVRPTHNSIPPLAAGSTEIPTLQVAPPAIPKPRRAGWLLVPALLAGAAGAALWFTAEGKTSTAEPDVSSLTREAEQLASTLDSVASTAQLRAEGLANSPMLRAAIETDSATIADMVRDGSVFAPKSGETIEIFQLRDGGSKSILRLPHAASPLPAGSETRLIGSGDALALVVTAPILKQNSSAVGGTLGLAIPIDTRTLVSRIGEHAVAAKLVGNGIAITLAQRGTTGVERTLPVRAKVEQLSLVATVSTPVIATAPNLVPAYACFGAAGLFGLLFLVAMVTRR